MDDAAATNRPSRVELDARNLRGIAHPVRVRLLTLLRVHGPATATSLARRLDLNTGATSYHLRQLAEHGFITDAPDRGNRRERWWQAAHGGTTFSRETLLTDDSELGPAYLHSVAQLYADRLLRASEALLSLPDEWRAAQDFSDYLLRLTPVQAKKLSAELHAVLSRYSDAGARRRSAGAVPATVQFQLFPEPDDMFRAPDDGSGRQAPEPDDSAGQDAEPGR